MLNVSKNIIEQFAHDVNQTAFENTIDIVVQRISLGMENLLAKNAFITGYQIEIANEVLTGGETPYSNVELFLEIDAPLIEQNQVKMHGNKYKNWLRQFWKEFRQNFKIFSKKKKSKKAMENAEKKLDQTKEYNISHLFKDIQIQIAKTHYKTASIQIYPNKILISDKTEYSSNIYVYPVFVHDKIIKQYNTQNSKVNIIDYKNRFDNIDDMNVLTYDMYTTLVRVLNTIFYSIFDRLPNQIFIESILYNVPVEFYTDDIYETTINVFNYLKNCSLNDLVSVCDDGTKLFKDKLNSETLDILLKLIRSVIFE